MVKRAEIDEYSGLQIKDATDGQNTVAEDADGPKLMVNKAKSYFHSLISRSSG